MHWNAEGINTKKTELEHFLHENNIHICCLQETHLQEKEENDKTKTREFKVRGYQIFPSGRRGKTKGGVMTLVRNNLTASETKRYMDEAEYIQVKITLKDTILEVVNYYCPDNKALSLDTITVPGSGFLITGDFNSQSQSWGYNTMDKRGEEIEAWQDENHLILVNDPSDHPTFYSRRWHSTTTPDLALCTDDVHKNITRTVGPQLGGSDHRPVLLSLDRDPPSISSQPPRWNYKKAKWSAFSIRTNELAGKIETNDRNINNVVKDFNACVLKAAKETIPKGVRKNYTPFWTEDLQTAEEKLNKAREKAEQTPSQENHLRLQESKAKYLRTKLECKRRSWRQKTASLNMEKDTTKLWKLTRALNEEGSRGQKITIEEDGEILTGKRAANAFATSYAKESDLEIQPQAQKESRQEQKDRAESNTTHPAMTEELTLEELRTAIQKLKKEKSPGPDGITNEMLQHLGNNAMKKLLDIFNLSWRTGEVPQC